MLAAGSPGALQPKTRSGAETDLAGNLGGGDCKTALRAESLMLLGTVETGRKDPQLNCDRLGLPDFAEIGQPAVVIVYFAVHDFEVA